MAARPPPAPGARRLVSFGLLMWSAALARAIPFEAGALSKADTNDLSLQPAGDQPSLDFEMPAHDGGAGGITIQHAPVVQRARLN